MPRVHLIQLVFSFVFVTLRKESLHRHIYSNPLIGHLVNFRFRIGQDSRIKVSKPYSDYYRDPVLM